MNKSVVYISMFFVFAVVAIILYERMVNKWDPKAYKPQYTQCASVYVRKSPHPCNAGDLIYIDRDVAEVYCTDNIIADFGDAVYCQYNGFREDLSELTKDVYDKSEEKKNSS